MLEISSKTNLLEKKSYKYSLQDVAEPNLHREVYSYGTIPKVAFNHRRVPMGMPEEIWITDTSLRDGQQSVHCNCACSGNHQRRFEERDSRS